MIRAVKYMLLLSFVAIVLSCNTTINKIFTRRTPHEAYAKQIESLPESKLWVEVSTKTLAMAQPIKLPYKHAGYFPGGKPRALSLLFNAKHGQRIQFTLLSKTPDKPLIFADIFRRDTTGFTHEQAIDTTATIFSYEAPSTGEYLLRLQPGLFDSAAYDLTITALPSIGFPVAGNKAKAGSYWGDARDGGHRSHEGVDIFAAKRTPAIAAADGYITGVKNGGIGGKTVWLRVNDRRIHLYYAHLDTQLVAEGDQVTKGDTLGLIGNTGNARFTPPHLHFGVYTSWGPVDPYPFIQEPGRQVPDVPRKDLTVQLQLKALTKFKPGSQFRDSTILVPLAVNADGYIVEYPDGRLSQTSFSSVKVI
jgi:murein DD-endopeptidase MepM/ murein hydrolase activator NlpD